MAIDTRKSTDVLFCAPSWTVAKTILVEVPAPKRFPILAHVRIALASAVADEGKYAKLTSYINGGDITGNLCGDRIFLAQQLVLWEEKEGRSALVDALEDRVIKIAQVAARITPELRRTLFTIERGTITGQIAHTE
jgi:hypothetical protein